jgi:aspartyl-tRNA(Asn)/glutamyl-tRNA(Gln) amidotransferase subunit B
MTDTATTAAGYEIVIGLEVHAQLATASKMFCGCSADYASAAPNTHVCPVCMALPGVLPVINRAAVEKTVLAGLALNCRIAPLAVFARKNYHYADLPKGYQISQYELPLCLEGWIDVEAGGAIRRIGITRAHLEEDTGKLTHVPGASLVDLNRAGVPLLEIVTEPDLRSAEEARAYLVKLQQILRYLGVSTADMEKGAMRCEANVSLRPVGSQAFGTKVEVKNLNSFRAVTQALEYEVVRQARLLRSGGRVQQVTMGWDEEHGRTVVQRSKEAADDYRYFPEPDLPPLAMTAEEVAALREKLPELPEARARRFAEAYGLDARDAVVLVAERSVADYYERAAAALAAALPAQAESAPRVAANWVAGELFRLMKDAGVEIEAVAVTPEALAGLLALVGGGKINPNSGKRVLDTMFRTGRAAQDIVAAEGLGQVSDAGALAGAVDAVLARHPAEVASYRAGKASVLGWLMGQVMRETGGKGNPSVVRDLLARRLDG